MLCRYIRRLGTGFRSFSTFREIKDPRKVIVISGLTGTGKTTCSIELAKKINGEVIIGDSMQFYRGMDIGTAKITENETQGIPHHLIDCLDPLDICTAGTFYKLASPVINDILERGKVPIVVGGTIFYLKWLFFGPQIGGPTETPLRESIQAEIEKDKDWDESIKRVEKLDPEYAQKIGRNDYQKLLRALVKLKQVDGKKLADLDNHTKSSPLEYDFRAFYLVRPRMQTKEIIAYRTEAFFQMGFIKEVANLMSYGLTLDHHASKAIGYREVMLRLMMKKCDANEIKKMITEIQVKTNQLAVSQLKFARNSQHLNLWRWIDVNNLSSGFEPTRPLSDLNINSVVDLIEKDYNTPLEEINTPRNLEYFSPPTHIYEAPPDARYAVPKLRMYDSDSQCVPLIRQIERYRK